MNENSTQQASLCQVALDSLHPESHLESPASSMQYNRLGMVWAIKNCSSVCSRPRKLNEQEYWLNDNMFKRPAIEWWKGCVSLNILYIYIQSQLYNLWIPMVGVALRLNRQKKHLANSASVFRTPCMKGLFWKALSGSPGVRPVLHQNPTMGPINKWWDKKKWVNMGQLFLCTKKEWKGWSGQIIHFPEKKTPFASISAWLPHTKTIISLAKSARSPSSANFEPVVSKFLIHSP